MSEYDYRDVLLKAASLVEEEGRWGQGALFRDRAGRPVVITLAVEQRDEVVVCAVGALYLTAERLGVLHQVALRARDALARSLTRESVGPWNDAPGRAGRVGPWNDAEGRTAHEVADAMREAAGA